MILRENAPRAAGTDPDLTVFVVTRFATEAARRVYHFLWLDGRVGRVVLVCQRADDALDRDARERILETGALPSPTALLDRVGLGGLRHWLDRRLFFPSPTVLYVRRARRVLARKIRHELARGRTVTVVTAVPPHDLLLVGLGLSRRYPEVRWVVDWGDLWTHDANYSIRAETRHHGRVRRLETRVLEASDLNVVTNERAAGVLTDRYGCDPDRVRAIPHAYGPYAEALAGPAPEQPEGGPLRVGYLGNLLKPPRVPGERLIAVFRNVRRRGLDVRLEVVGDKVLHRRRADYAADRDWLSIVPRLPHVAALRRVARCHHLLVLLSDDERNRAVLPMKLPYHFALRRPTLALVPQPSAVADAVRSTGAGRVLDSGGDWERGLHDALAAPPSDPPFRPNRIQRYSWHRVSGLWSAALRGVPLGSAPTGRRAPPAKHDPPIRGRGR